MSTVENIHRPLLAGVEIDVWRLGKKRESGTLTGLARLKSDRSKKVLVTNHHVVSGYDNDENLRNVIGDEFLYQGTDLHELRVSESPVPGPIQEGEFAHNKADAAMCGA